MNYCYRCGLTATYYITTKDKWACSEFAQKCPVIRNKIGKSNKESLTGRKLSDEHKKSIANSNIGRIVSDETKNKIKQSNLEYWAINQRTPWNKDKTGLQVAWNKGRKKEEPLEILSREDPAYSNFRKYRNRISVRTKKVYEEFKSEINPNNFPIGKAGIIGAYQIDHKISVRKGFDSNISIEDISSKENLQVIPWLENIKKK